MLRQTIKLYTFSCCFLIKFQVAPIEDPLKTSHLRFTVAIMVVLITSQSQ